MSALSYICDYGDDETDEDSLSEDSVIEDIVNVKRVKLPTPNLSGVSVVLPEDHIDDPSLHQSCIRAFPHVRGNWATFTYIEYPNKENLLPLIEKLETLITSLNELCIVNEIAHISLSKTFVLRYHMIKSFVTSLQTVFSSCVRFHINFDSFEVYCNEDQTRTFLALKVDTSSHGYLSDMIKRIDCILNEYRLPTFYEDPSFHMSLLSVNGNKREKFLNIIHSLNEILVEQNNNVLKPQVINRVNCKSGNKYYQFYLKQL